MPQPVEHKILLITTGGTIGGNVAEDEHPTSERSPEERKADRKQDAAGLQQIIAETVDRLEEELNLRITVDAYDLANIDSSDVQPGLWGDLATLIQEKFDDYDSFIITHGTNTLGYTCAALSFAIANSGKPIVLTGSQVPMGDPGSDALANLQNAMRVATWNSDRVRPGKRSGSGMMGVMAVFGSFIITGTRVKKDTEFDYDAFKSFGGGAIGRIGRIINVNAANLERHNSYLRTAKYPEAVWADQLHVQKQFNMNIVSLTEFPGMGDVFETLVNENRVEGFILRAFGAGDPASDLQDAFRWLKTKEIPIVVTTQAPNGISNFQVNVGGQWLKKNQAAIPAHDMSIEAMTTKLGWLLARKSGKRYGYDDIYSDMLTDMRGEINVMWEMR